ncbi:hypothetical protein ACFYUY_17340 [Kitasatospora sp. NPDC004745]|uniref:hypothetical protein n=1 Tax=Kitasatospora sp. NPDC004745 TaxID=3364019 RepID=UPI003690ED54
MRANHATRPQEPAPRGVTGARRSIRRWLPHPRAVAAGGALLAQLWGIGAPGAYAASAEPPPEGTRPAVRRTAPHDGGAHGGPAPRGAPRSRPATGGSPPDGTSAGPPPEAGHQPGGETARPSGPVGEPPGTGLAGTTGAVGGLLQDRIRAGGLPLPGQRAAVPDAFAIASGLLDTAPAQGRRVEARAPREGEPSAPPTAARPGSGPGRTAATAHAPHQPRAAATPPPARETVAPDPRSTADRGVAGTATAAPVSTVTPDGPAAPIALADTAPVTAVGDDSATVTAVLAPIAAGLLLTGAAMCKHRGLPRGH